MWYGPVSVRTSQWLSSVKMMICYEAVTGNAHICNDLQTWNCHHIALPQTAILRQIRRTVILVTQSTELSEITNSINTTTRSVAGNLSRGSKFGAVGTKSPPLRFTGETWQHSTAIGQYPINAELSCQTYENLTYHSGPIWGWGARSLHL